MGVQKSIIKTDYQNSPLYYWSGTPPRMLCVKGKQRAKAARSTVSNARPGQHILRV